jgi:hypothetical protein
MKRITLLLLTILIAAYSFAQGKVINDPNAEERKVSNFQAIKVSHGIDLIITQSNTEGLAISATEKEFRDRIITEVENGVLKISYDIDKWWKKASTPKKLKAYVSFINIDKIEGTSGAQITIENGLRSKSLEVALSSGASLTGDIKVSKLNLTQSSGASSTITGEAISIKIKTSSGAIFHGYDFTTDICDADASSGGSIQVTVNRELSAEASSGGGIRYKGDGVITKVSASFAGSVKKYG